MPKSRQFKSFLEKNLGRLSFQPSISSELNSDFTPLLAKDIRAFLCLLPARGIALGWASKPKRQRYDIIKEHLKHVLQDSSKEIVVFVDGILKNMQESRRNLSSYRELLVSKYACNCFICGTFIDKDATVDHVFPFSWGGSNEIENLLLAHAECNSAKKDWKPGDFTSWAAERWDQDPQEISGKLRYLVFLRDGFRCQIDNCKHTIEDRQLWLGKRLASGITCYDNLITQCEDCC
ncbi:HNH endonuclease [Pirellulales bacterium]|nr:HNH endonuclease [Pirellulales bacterium]